MLLWRAPVCCQQLLGSAGQQGRAAAPHGSVRLPPRLASDATQGSAAACEAAWCAATPAASSARQPRRRPTSRVMRVMAACVVVMRWITSNRRKHLGVARPNKGERQRRVQRLSITSSNKETPDSRQADLSRQLEASAWPAGPRTVRQPQHGRRRVLAAAAAAVSAAARDSASAAQACTRPIDAHSLSQRAAGGLRERQQLRLAQHRLASQQLRQLPAAHSRHGSE